MNELQSPRTPASEADDIHARRHDELSASIDELKREFASLKAAVRGSHPLDGRELARTLQRRLLEIFHVTRLATRGAAATATPVSDIVQTADGENTQSFDMIGSNPQLIVAVQNRPELPAGRYILSFKKLAGGDSLVSPILCSDSGNGFSEHEAQLLNLASFGSDAVAQFILPRASKRLRIVPSVAKGRFSFDSIRLRRVTAGEYYARLLLHVTRARVRSVQDIKQYSLMTARLLRSEGLAGLAARLRASQTRVAEFAAPTYQAWIEKHDTPSVDDVRGLRNAVERLVDRPPISVLMPVYNTPINLLREAIESVRAQIYDNWELCIADDCSPEPQIRALLDEYAKGDPRIKVVFRSENGHISEATNSAFTLATGDWIALLDHDDILRSNALAEVALELAAHPDAQLIYSDEDKIDANGRRFDAHFKPDFSRELFRSQNYLNHLTVHRASNIRSVGGWRKGYEGSQDYDLNLKIFELIDPSKIRHIAKILYHWRAVAGSTATAGSEKSYAYSAGQRALQDHVSRTRLPAKVLSVPRLPFYRLRFDIPEPAPLVSIIIPTRDKAYILRNCITSIRSKTTYKNYEIIIVDNASKEDETLEYLEILKHEPNIRILSYDDAFNYSAINNFAVRHGNGAVLALLNNDVEVISEEWLGEMVSWAWQPEIGCVGAKLYYSNGTIQHAGVVLGVGGVANHAHLYEPRETAGYFGRAMVLGNFSAVTGACLMVRKAVYEQVGGLNERDLRVAFNDVDFCLKVRDAGYSNVWTPYAELYHHESLSRGRDDTADKSSRFASEVDYMMRTWGPALKSDPFYSVHFSMTRPNFVLMS